MQPQLFPELSLENDKVYTPAWVARDMVDWFKPTGCILEPCRGGGAFMRYLPADTEWCEIDEGRDFFAWTEPVDWIISNPPYSLIDEWLTYSYKIADNIVYLLQLNKVLSAHLRMRRLFKYGGPVHVRMYGGGGRVGFPMGNLVAAIHLKRGYRGDTSWSWYETLDMD